MLPVLGGLLSGSLGLLGNYFAAQEQNKNNQEMQQQAQAFNASQTQQQMAFQEQMSSSAYQRASADMQKAGLNPAMMFGSGSAASSPGGAAAVTQPAVKTSALGTIGPSLERVVSSAIAGKTFEKMTDEIANLKTTNERIIAEIASERERPALIRASTKTEQERPAEVRERTWLTKNQAGVTSHEIGIRRAAALKAANEEAFQRTTAGGYLDQGALIGRRVGDIVRPVGDVVNSAGSVIRALRAPTSHTGRFPAAGEGFRTPSISERAINLRKANQGR